MKPLWFVVLGGALAATFLIKPLRMAKSKIFDTIRSTELSGKLRTESTFAYLNRSVRPGSAASRALLRLGCPAFQPPRTRSFALGSALAIMSNLPPALQELTLHELLRRQGCKLRFHPKVSATTKQPDFNVRQPKGPEFLLEACTSTEIAGGPF